MGGSKDKTAGSSRHGVTGPTDREPYALDWADYPASVLRAFAKVFPDADGFDASAQELMEMDQQQLVAKCEEIQIKCNKAIDRPWAMELMELFAESESYIPAELQGLTFNELDRVALGTLARAQESIKRRLARSKSSRPKGKATTGPPDEAGDENDDLPLSMLDKADKESDEGYNSPGSAVAAAGGNLRR